MLVGTPADLAVMARARRAELKLGQADVARAVGVSRHWIMRFESGGAVELDSAMRTLAHLGIELSAHFTRPPPDWTVPLTTAAGTLTRPYSRHRRARRPLSLSEVARAGR